MAGLTENQVLEVLGIPDFRHLSKANVMEFASLIQEMEPEVAMKALEQFPDFANTVSQAMHDYKDVIEKSLDKNESSTNSVYDIYNNTARILEKQLDKGDITVEERMYILDKLMELAKMADAKDTENKAFLSNMNKYLTVALGLTLCAVAAVLGVNTDFNLPWKNNS